MDVKGCDFRGCRKWPSSVLLPLTFDEIDVCQDGYEEGRSNYGSLCCVRELRGHDRYALQPSKMAIGSRLQLRSATIQGSRAVFQFFLLLFKRKMIHQLWVPLLCTSSICSQTNDQCRAWIIDVRGLGLTMSAVLSHGWSIYNGEALASE
jgi:hypothetical protein